MRLVNAEDVKARIDKFFEDSGIVIVGKNIGYYPGLMECVDDAPTMQNDSPSREAAFPETLYGINIMEAVEKQIQLVAHGLDSPKLLLHPRLSRPIGVAVASGYGASPCGNVLPRKKDLGNVIAVGRNNVGKGLLAALVKLKSDAVFHISLRRLPTSSWARGCWEIPDPRKEACNPPQWHPATSRCSKALRCGRD